MIEFWESIFILNSCIRQIIFFPVLPIKDMINKDGEPTTPFKIVTCKKPSVSHLRVLFFPCVIRKSTAHVDKNSLNMCHQAPKGFRVICVGIR